MPYRKSTTYDGLNEILEQREEEIGRKQEQIGCARRQKHNPWLTESCAYGQGKISPFHCFNTPLSPWSSASSTQGGKTGKKSKHKMNERKTIFWHEGNSLISLMKYLNWSSSSKAPSIAPGYGCCGGCSHKEEETTKKREQWEDSGGPLKMVVRRNISVGHL